MKNGGGGNCTLVQEKPDARLLQAYFMFFSDSVSSHEKDHTERSFLKSRFAAEKKNCVASPLVVTLKIPQTKIKKMSLT